MKVLGICCGRKNGNTEIMMKEVFRAIREQCGAQCSLVRLQEAKINSCTGCEACITNRMKGVEGFRCAHPNESDHFYFIEQLAREADAVIVCAPSYFLMPPGILINFLDRFHGSGDYEIVTARTPKVGACFTLGGSDWNNFTPPLVLKAAAELAGSFAAVVDQCHFSHVPSPGAVVLREDIMARMALLGEHVAQAMLERQAGEAPIYRGEPGLCPDCHGNFLEKRADGWHCPQCMTRAALTSTEVVFSDEARAVNRWSEPGDRVHKESIGREHQRAAREQAEIHRRAAPYLAMDDAVKLS